jgi:hypothetical protein
MVENIVEKVFLPIAQILIYIFFFSSLYLLVKYKTLVFWEKASRKELMLPVIGFFGAFIMGLVMVIALLMAE